MIEINVKIHDKFSFEFKTSFITNKKTFLYEKANEFSINTWMFIPNNLDINRSTYSKDSFYKDNKSNIRLITPVYLLSEIYDKQNPDSPICRIKEAFKAFAADVENTDAFENYTFQIKMFSSITKSAIRDRVNYIISECGSADIQNLIENYIHDVKMINRGYHDLWLLINKQDITKEQQDHYFFGDDFIGNVIEQHTYALMGVIERYSVYDLVKKDLVGLVKSGMKRKIEKGYSYVDEDNPTNNYLVIMRRSMLKKYMESDLYLNTKQTKDGAIAEQMYYAIAAGVSMIFATIISFSAQLHYGNFTIPLFFALVISYAFKDRIKDLMRYYFSTQLGKKYFDTKRELEMRNQKIGWVKEAFDFVLENKVPEEVSNLRKRSPLVEAENKIYNEQILLYKKLVSLSSGKIKKYKGYKYIGINDITRFNVTHFIQKMDNPFVSLYLPDDEFGYKTIESEKVYTIYFIIRAESENVLYYRKFRLLFNREGIKNIVEIND
ncbi:hypothetical protein D0T53_06325 [Dysgonomonas sp. 216]|uniref:hypothetical protein n=1 Tax=Dysgonomonas sp. 216 TaxID=2302934 RepID=UPI0013D3C43F|nr:hypothetical protein [Dysgonomonas sp. 216]NDW18529.1 hypothetical protein [Dysgonomonas sp. 216]